jgi:hypothetical protein
METRIRGEVTYRDGSSEVRGFDSMEAWVAFVEDSRDHPEVETVELLPRRAERAEDAH